MNSINVNGQTFELDVTDDMPLLWAIRDIIGFTGTKFGCGMGLCGACTIHLDGNPVRSCQTPVGSVAGKKIITIEAMGSDPIGIIVQQAWVAEGVPQCGFCQGGQIMSATALLRSNPAPDDETIENHMSGNLCRCGTYNRIKTAINTASAKIKGDTA